MIVVMLSLGAWTPVQNPQEIERVSLDMQETWFRCKPGFEAWIRLDEGRVNSISAVRCVPVKEIP
jgi:hypothetical protein